MPGSELYLSESMGIAGFESLASIDWQLSKSDKLTEFFSQLGLTTKICRPSTLLRYSSNHKQSTKKAQKKSYLPNISSENLAKFERMTDHYDFYPRFVFSQMESNIQITYNFFGSKYKNTSNKVELSQAAETEELDIAEMHFNKTLQTKPEEDMLNPSSPLKVDLKR